jgi:hypothetical protein
MLDKILNWFALILVLIGAIGTVGLITYLISLFITRKYEMLDKMLDWFFFDSCANSSYRNYGIGRLFY